MERDNVFDEEEFTYDHAFHSDGRDNDQKETSSNKSAKKSNCKFFLNRLAFCLFAQVALWMTSLRNSTIIASNYVSAPTFSSVYTSCNLAHETAISEKTKYDLCVKMQLNQCNNEFSTRLNTENERVALSAQNNLGITTILQAKLKNCSDTIANSKLIMESWSSGKHVRDIPYKMTCSTESKQQLQSFLGEDYSASNQATLSASTYVSNFDSRVVTMATYTKDLSDYNRDYLRNKTKFLHLQSLGQIDTTMLQNLPSILDELNPVADLTTDILACMSLDSTMAAQCKYPENLYEAYVTAQQDLNNEIDELYSSVNAYRQVVLNYVDQVQVAFIKADLFYQSVFGKKGVITWLLDTVKIIYSLGDMCGNSVPNLCSFDPSDWDVPTPNWPEIPQAIAVPDASQIFSKVEGYISTIPPRIEKVSASLTAELSSLQEDLHFSLGSIDWVPNDYSPPRYPQKNDSNQEITDQRKESQQYLTDLSNILYANTSSLSFNPSSAIQTILATNPSSLINSTWIQGNARSVWAWVENKSIPWSIGNVQFAWILQSFFTLQGILFLFDYLYRGIQSLRLFIRFWSRSVVRLPTLKAVEEEENALFNTVSSTVKCFQLFFQLLPLLWIQALVLLAMLIATIFILATLVVPEYYSYCRACVHHTANETYLTQLTQTGVYNLAASSGNARWETGFATFNSHYTATCDKGIATTQQTYSKSLQSLQNINQTYGYYVHQAQLLHSCIDMNAMDTDIDRLCCASENCVLRNTSLSSQCPFYLQTAPSSDMFFQDLWWNNDNQPTEEMCSQLYLLQEKVLSNSKTTNKQNLQFNINQDSSSVHSIVWQNGLNDKTSWAMFDCSALPTCQLTCGGPDEIMLARRSKDCMCRVEWFWNAHLLQGSLVIVIFLVLNISRDLVCSGLLRVWWSMFLPPVMNVLISVPLPGYSKDKDKDKDKTYFNSKHHGDGSQCNAINNTDQKNVSVQNQTNFLLYFPFVHNQFGKNKNLSRNCSQSYEEPITTFNDIEAAHPKLIPLNDQSDEISTVNSDITEEEYEVPVSDRKEKTTKQMRLQTIQHMGKKRWQQTKKSRFQQLPPRKANSSITKQKERSRRAQHQMKWKLFWFVFMGYVKIAVGVAINYIWYAIAKEIERNISYDGNPYPDPHN